MTSFSSLDQAELDDQGYTVPLFGLILLVTVICAVMTFWELGSGVKRLWQGKGTLWS
jgi:hypothetical protein